MKNYSLTRAIQRQVQREARELAKEIVTDQRCAVLLIVNEEVKRLPPGIAYTLMGRILKRVEKELA